MKLRRLTLLSKIKIWLSNYIAMQTECDNCSMRFKSKRLGGYDFCCPNCQKAFFMLGEYKSGIVKITKTFLHEDNVCKEGYDWWYENCQGLTDIETLKKVAEHNFDWFIWLIVRLFSVKKNQLFAIKCAELVLPIYEKHTPDCNIPKKAIKAAKKCIENPTEENIKIALAAIDSASTSGRAAQADDASWAAASSAWAAHAAAYAAQADDASWAAAAAASAAHAAIAADATRYTPEIKNKIVGYGIELLKNI